MSDLKIMFIADLCGKGGRQAASFLTRHLKERFEADFVITNVENAAGGFGVTPEMSKKIFSYGTDVQTSGNHIWDRVDIIKYFNTDPKLLRPANFPKRAPGKGYIIEDCGGYKIAVINLMGRAYMKDLDCPFQVADFLLAKIKPETNIIFIDFHGEATAEKQAMMYHLDGQVSAIVGTHTHVQTADEQVTENGTAYITDAGMTGGYKSVIGMKIDPSLKRFLTGMPYRFTPSEEDVKMSGVVVTIDASTGRAKKIERFIEDFDINNPPETNYNAMDDALDIAEEKN